MKKLFCGWALLPLAGLPRLDGEFSSLDSTTVHLEPLKHVNTREYAELGRRKDSLAKNFLDRRGIFKLNL